MDHQSCRKGRTGGWLPSLSWAKFLKQTWWTCWRSLVADLRAKWTTERCWLEWEGMMLAGPFYGVPSVCTLINWVGEVLKNEGLPTSWLFRPRSWCCSDEFCVVSEGVTSFLSWFPVREVLLVQDLVHLLFSSNFVPVILTDLTIACHRVEELLPSRVPLGQISPLIKNCGVAMSTSVPSLQVWFSKLWS